MILRICWLLIFFSLFSCNDQNHQMSLQEWMAQNGKLKVLSTTSMIGELVKQIGGEFVDASVLIKGDLDPHSYQLVKGDDEKLAFADLIFYNGLGLEHGPSLQNTLSNSPKAISLGDAVRKTYSELILQYKGEIDPHLWMDISLWAKTIPFIAEALTQKDPAHAEAFQKNAQKVQQEMQIAHAEVHDALHKLPPSKRFLVTSHDAFNYFARAYLAEEGESEELWRERFNAPEGLAPESQISTSDIQRIIQHLDKYNIRVLFPESNVNRDSIRKIVHAANEKGIEVTISSFYLYADAMGQPGSDGDSYIKMIKHDATTIAHDLGLNGG